MSNLAYWGVYGYFLVAVAVLLYGFIVWAAFSALRYWYVAIKKGLISFEPVEDWQVAQRVSQLKAEALRLAQEAHSAKSSALSVELKETTAQIQQAEREILGRSLRSSGVLIHP